MIVFKVIAVVYVILFALILKELATLDCETEQTLSAIRELKSTLAQREQ